MKCNPIPERPDWFITDRKPTICPRCSTREVRKAILGKPTEADYFREDLFLLDVFLIFQFVELGAAENVTLHFLKILQEIKLH